MVNAAKKGLWQPDAPASDAVAQMLVSDPDKFAMQYRERKKLRLLNKAARVAHDKSSDKLRLADSLADGSPVALEDVAAAVGGLLSRGMRPAHIYIDLRYGSLDDRRRNA